jgi:hypothetical protein
MEKKFEVIGYHRQKYTTSVTALNRKEAMERAKSIDDNDWIEDYDDLEDNMEVIDAYQIEN